MFLVFLYINEYSIQIEGRWWNKEDKILSYVRRDFEWENIEIIKGEKVCLVICRKAPKDDTEKEIVFDFSALPF